MALLVTRVAARWLSRLALGTPEVVYTAVFLAPMDRHRLLNRFPPVHPEVFAHHMTIWFRGDSADPGLEALPLGQTVALKILGHAHDDKAQAVVVQPPTALRPFGQKAHVTISTAPGVLPVYSNTLLVQTWDAESARRGYPVLRGRVGWWDGQKERFNLP